MNRKTFITTMPDRAGAFRVASQIICDAGGNIVRVSFNKAVDVATLFIDVEAEEASLLRIQEQLEQTGYLKRQQTEISVLTVEIRIPDRAGALMPVLEIFERYDINISYINSVATGESYQNFVMGVLIRDIRVIECMMGDIAKLYPVQVIEERGELDNSVFYINFAREIQGILSLNAEQTNEFISEANRTMQLLFRLGESPENVFEHIRAFARFVASRRGDQYQCEVKMHRLSPAVMLYQCIPPCGSNTYLMKTQRELVIIDTGYAVYHEEWLAAVRKAVPEFDALPKRLYLTHADIDHCGLVGLLDAQVMLTEKTAQCLKLQYLGISDFREAKTYCLGYTKLNRIISAYRPYDISKAVIIDRDTPPEHEQYCPVGSLCVGDQVFEILEGSGGHLRGECIFINRQAKLVLTGDIWVNIKGFSEESAKFNAVAPYLMRSVNVDSVRASSMRKELAAMVDETYLICPGHGPMFYPNER